MAADLQAHSTLCGHGAMSIFYSLLYPSSRQRSMSNPTPPDNDDLVSLMFTYSLYPNVICSTWCRRNAPKATPLQKAGPSHQACFENSIQTSVEGVQSRSTVRDIVTIIDDVTRVWKDIGQFRKRLIWRVLGFDSNGLSNIRYSDFSHSQGRPSSQ